MERAARERRVRERRPLRRGGHDVEDDGADDAPGGEGGAGGPADRQVSGEALADSGAAVVAAEDEGDGG